MKSWYVAKTGNDQGLVIEEETGRNVAVTYRKEDAPLVAGAPDMLAALKLAADFVDAYLPKRRREFQDFTGADKAISRAEEVIGK